MKCRKCGSGNMGVMPNKKNPSATDLYCLDCGAWQKFATKDEIRLYQCKKGPITNADRIRAMSDHDLAVFLEHAMYDSSEPDWMTVLSWLQQPAEEGNNGH
mgnify:CR=1 FL=1